MYSVKKNQNSCDVMFVMCFLCLSCRLTPHNLLNLSPRRKIMHDRLHDNMHYCLEVLNAKCLMKTDIIFVTSKKCHLINNTQAEHQHRHYL